MEANLPPEIIGAACEGDVEAIEQVLLQYHSTLTRFARKFCATPEDVEDAVQETLWIAAQKIGTLRVTEALVSWLFRVIQNQCYRLLHLKAHEESLDQVIDIRCADENPEYYTMLKHDIIVALAQLPPQHRQVFIMREIQEQSTAEVAARLNLTVETIKSRLHYARNELRKSLEQWRD